MNSGDIILIDFPFTVPTQSKVRPAVVITETRDKYNNLVVCAISSVLPPAITGREILISKNDPAFSATGLRADSVIKIDRIATLRQSDVITKLGHCEPALWDEIRNKFRNLV
ncbi:MAG: type II toxin-antitoxin system PemK/MazF family toxin [bacterium]